MSLRMRETLEKAMALKVLSPLMSMSAARVRKRSERSVLRDMGKVSSEKLECNLEIRDMQEGFYSVSSASRLSIRLGCTFVLAQRRRFSRR